MDDRDLTLDQEGFAIEIGELGTPEANIDFFEVTGAFEIPLNVRRLAESGPYDAIVAAGLVVDGGIYRHEFVAEAVIGGLMQVQLETDVPVLSAVLTPHHFHEHETHRSFFLRAPRDQGDRGRSRLRAHGRRPRAATAPRPSELEATNKRCDLSSYSNEKSHHCGHYPQSFEAS